MGYFYWEKLKPDLTNLKILSVLLICLPPPRSGRSSFLQNHLKIIGEAYKLFKDTKTSVSAAKHPPHIRCLQKYFLTKDYARTYINLKNRNRYFIMLFIRNFKSTLSSLKLMIEEELSLN